MHSKTSRKDVAKDKASELLSAATDAAEAGRDKIAPVVENVTGHLSDAADKATEAAAPHVAKAKETVAEAAAPHVAKAKEAAAEASDTAAPHVARSREKAKDAAGDASEIAAPRVATVKKQVKQAKKQAEETAKQTKKQARKQAKSAKKAASDASDSAAPRVARAKEATGAAAGLTSEQARQLFHEEWMPRVHEAIAAAGAAGGSAYAALPQRARDAVDVVAPEVVKKRRKKGGLLITLGLLAGAGAVALIVSGKKGGATKAEPKLPEVERIDARAAEDTAVVSTSDDAVGDLEKKADSTVSGGRRGRHAAQE